MSVLEDLYPSRQKAVPELLDRCDPVVYGGVDQKDGGPLTQNDLMGFEENGFLFLESLFSAEEVALFVRELDVLTKAPEQGPTYIREPGSGDVRSVFQIHRDNALFRRLSQDHRVVNVAKQILGSEVYIHQSRINLKPGFVGKEFYWHSDFETWHVEDGMPRMRAISCSINLTENFVFNGAVMVVPGSHKHYIACVGETPADHYKQSLRKQEYGVPDQEVLAALVKRKGIKMPIGPAGSVLFFDCNIMHGSNGNITPYPRSNVFFVFNSVENRLVQPFGNIPPRPEFIAARDGCDALLSLRGPLHQPLV